MENLNMIINIKFNCLNENNASKNGSEDKLSEVFYAKQMLLYYCHTKLVSNKYNVKYK